MTRTTVKYSPALFLLAALLLPGDAHAQSGSQCYFDCYTYAEYDPDSGEIYAYSEYEEQTCTWGLDVEAYIGDPNDNQDWVGSDQGYCQVEVDYSYARDLDGIWEAYGDNYYSPEGEWSYDGESWYDVDDPQQVPTSLEVIYETTTPESPCAWDQNQPPTECGNYVYPIYQVLDQDGTPIQRVLYISDTFSNNYDSCGITWSNITPIGTKTYEDGLISDKLGACTLACCSNGACTTGCYTNATQYWLIHTSYVTLDVWFFCNEVDIDFS
ncbi:MAG: hypothetical protein ABSF25_23030 [Bryobacteraceae bacterium]